jgi:hypothetical protein
MFGYYSMFSISPSEPHDNPEVAAPPRVASFTDVIIILLISAGTVLTFPALSRTKPENVAIFKDNRLIATYPLSTDRTVSVAGILGTLEITIKNRSASITHAECPHGICKKSGSIRTPHSQIVCAPNHIVVTITSSQNDTLDAIVR